MFRVIMTAEALRAVEQALTRSDAEGKEVIQISLIRLRTLLEYDAANFGESREGRIRVGFAGVCGIFFIVDAPEEGLVRVLDFWLTRRP